MNTTHRKRSFVPQFAALILGLTAGASFAYDPGDYSTWMQLKGNSGTYTGSVWCDPADQTQKGVPAEVGKCYYVASGKVANSGLRGADPCDTVWMIRSMEIMV